jgi:hypothetical protein
MSVIFENFNSLEQLVDTIESRPFNGVFQGEGGRASHRIESGIDDFYGTRNYQESIDLIKNGYHEPMETMRRELLKVNKQGPAPKRKAFNSVQGFAPHVPNALAGIPTAMINREKMPVKSRTVHLIYGFSAVGDVRASELIKGGTMFIGLVNALERAGVRVKLDILRCTTSSAASAIGYTCNLKQYGQSLNLLKLCYPLVHPSMLRRTSFRWCETLPNLKDHKYYGSMGTSLIVRMGWGRTVKSQTEACKKEKEFLKKHGVIKDKNTYYCNVYEAMNSKNINELAQRMGLAL